MTRAIWHRPTARLALALFLALSGCAHHVVTPTALDLARCPDPPPLHQNVMIGSTLCEVR